MAKNKKLDILAITNEIQSYSAQGHSIYNGDMINYGLDNLYPNKVFDITQNSPTAGGCVKRKAEFVFGIGVDADIIVNRHGATINDVIKIAVNEYTKYNGYALHFNYNLMGQIVEIQNIDLRYVRKMKDLKSVVVGRIFGNSGVIYSGASSKIKLPLYNKNGIRDYIKQSKGFKKFNGAVYYFNANSGLYPICPHEASLTSAQFEHEAQVYSFMNVLNGFSGSGILKLPSIPDDEQKKKDMEDKIRQVVGSKNAGSMLIIEAPKNMEAELDSTRLFETFQTQNVDKLHEVQCNRSKDYILRDFNMPEILLGVSNNGMFNQESFRDAFNYYNGNTESNRSIIERSFNKFWPETSFSGELAEIKISPLEIKMDNQTQKDSQDGTNTAK